MARRKKIEADDEESGQKRGQKKGRRVDLKVRVARPVPINKQELEEEYGELLEASDNLTQRAVEEDAISPETVEEIARKIAELKSERDKKIFMWIGVTFIMMIVLIVWAYNLRVMFREQAERNRGGQELNIDQISAQFNKTMEEVSNNLSKLDELSAATTTPSTTVATGTPQEINFENTTDVVELRSRLEELERRLNYPATTTPNVNIPKR